MLRIDSSPSKDGEEGEEFILHSSSSWSSLDARGGIEVAVGEGGDVYDTPIYGFGLRDYFRNNPRLGRADGDVPTTRDSNPSHESEDGVVRSSRRRRDHDSIDTAVQRQSANREEVPRHSMPRFKGKEPSSFLSSTFSSSSVLNNNNYNNSNGAYQSSSSSSSSLRTPPVTAPQHHHHQHRDTGSSYSNNKILFEFALSEYPLYRRDSGLGTHTTATSSTVAAAAEGYDPLSHLMEEEMESGGGDRSSTTMILGSEWETFRRIGLGVGG